MPFLRKSSPPPPPLLAEIVTPRINAAPLAAMQTGLAGIALTESVSLEMWGTGKARWFLARAHSPLAHEHLTGALGAAYPARSVHSHQALHPSGVCDHSTDGALTAVAHWSRVVCGMGTRSAR